MYDIIKEVKDIRKALKIVYLLAVAVTALFAAMLIAVQSPQVQTRLAEKALRTLENHIDGRISIGKIHIDPFKAVLVKDIAVIDTDPYVDSSGTAAPDTLFRARYVSATFGLRSLLSGGSLSLSSAKVTDGLFTLVIEPGRTEADTTGTVNLKRIFRLGSGNRDRKPSDKEVFSIADVELDGMAFRMRNFRKDASRYAEDEMNWFDLDVEDIKLKGRNMKMKGGVMYGTCDKLSMREKSGFVCHYMSGRTRVGNGRTVIDDLRIIDNWSDIDMPRLEMTYRNTAAWSDFISAVHIHGDIRPSTVSMNTLGYFAPALKRFRMTAKLNGKVDGYVNDLRLDDITFESSDAEGFTSWNSSGDSGIAGNLSGSIIGLPDSQGMMLEADVRKLMFTSSGLEKFIRGWAPEASLNIRNLCKGEKVTFKGHLKGPLNKLTVRGTLHSGFGKVSADIGIRNVIDKARPIALGGNISTDELDISRIIGGVPVGKCTMHSGLSATLGKDGPEMTIDSLKVDRLDVLGYGYTGIAAAGTFSQEAFNGRIVCSDPNLNFLFQGIFSLSSKTRNALYQFYANLGYADLHALNIDRRGTSRISLTTQANFTRVSGEDILGNINVNGVVLEDEHGRHNIGDIEISSYANNDLNRVKFKSGFAEGSYSGTKFFSSFIRDIKEATAGRALPALRMGNGIWSGNRYDASVRFHDTKDILSFFAPGTYIADSTALNLSLSRDGSLKAGLTSGRIAYKDKYMKGIDLKISNPDESIEGSLIADEIMFAPILARSGKLNLFAKADSLGASFSYDNATEPENRGELFINGLLYRDAEDSLAIRTGFSPSYIYLKSRLWKITSSDIDIRRNGAHVSGLKISGDDQAITLDGGYSSSASDTLQLNLDKFDISIANAFSSSNMGISGRVTGRAMLISPSGDRAGILMNMTCDSTTFAGRRAGTVKAAGVWDDETQGFNYFCRNLIDGGQTFGASGHFYPKSGTLDGTIRLNGLDAGYAMPFLNSVFSGIDGNISGEIGFNGPLSNLELSSSGLHFDRTRLRVDFTNVEYVADGPASLDSGGVRFDNVSITDRFNEKGTISGSILWDHFRNMRFDTAIRFSRMEVLNLGESDNPIFYGNLSATGDLSITGPLNAILLSADARTVKRGDFHIPMNSSSSAGKSNLLTFKEPYREIRIDPYEEMMRKLKEKEKKANDLGIKLKINATPEVAASIEIDKSAGNVLTGSGNGIIDLEVRPGTGLFTINGNYVITTGTYHFVALGIAKRDFTIQDGSSIRFNGDIMDSNLDIKALYKTKASVGMLISDTTSTSRRTVECGIAITDKLSNPRLDFSISIPDLDPTTQSRVESALNTQDKIQKQLLALLISNSFLPDEQSGITNTSSSMLYSNVSEIMAGQLNNILQKLNIPVDFGLDYQQNAGGTDIFDVALSTALFNNRVIVNGTIGNRQYNSSSSGSEVVGDLDIDVKMDKPGALRLNLFSHSADQYTNYLDNSQRNGVGITYQKEYDRLGDFIRNIFRSRKKKQALEAERQQAILNEKKVKIRINADKDEKRNGKRR